MTFLQKNIQTMEEKPVATTDGEPAQPKDRMAKARAALAKKRAASKLFTLQKEAERIEEKIKEADEYSKTHPPIPIQQPMEMEEPVQAPDIHEEKIIENEKPIVQEEAIVAKPIQETKQMSSSEDIIVTPIDKENRIEAPKQNKRKRESEKIKKKKDGRKKKQASSSESSESSSSEEAIQPTRREIKRRRLVTIPQEPLEQPSIVSRITEGAGKVANGIRSIPIPDHVTNFARDSATNFGWACVVFAGVLFQRYAFQVGTNYLFPGGKYPHPSRNRQEPVFQPPPFAAERRRPENETSNIGFSRATHIQPTNSFTPASPGGMHSLSR
ncbi:MAG TPA: hypothetical protein VFP45_03425 [Candidatus Nitrosotalea sp.]|nr:hypothetical protein [Candidatus Nitrosotalea sp.]